VSPREIGPKERELRELREARHSAEVKKPPVKKSPPGKGKRVP
jgi:hypothetical protein